jgi:hypothetical protein
VNLAGEFMPDGASEQAHAQASIPGQESALIGHAKQRVRKKHSIE